MLEINLKQLEAFVAAVEYESFTQAAQGLYLTQSTVSAHILALEEILGRRLIIRGSRRKFTVTDEGKQVYGAAKDILSRCQALQAMEEQGFDEILLGASTVPAQHLLPELMSGFLERYAKTRFVLKKGGSEQVHRFLEQGAVRIGFVGSMPDEKRFEYRELARDRLVLITQASPRFRSLDAGAALELLKEPMIARDASSGTQQEADSYLRTRNIAPEKLRLVARVDSPEAIKTMVETGAGVSIISELSVRAELESGRLLAFPLEPDGPYRGLYIVWRRGVSLSPAEERFVRFVLTRSDVIDKNDETAPVSET